VARKVCGGAAQAASKSLGIPLAERIADPDPASLRCVLTGHQVVVTVSSQATPRAYTEFDTEVAHQEQVYGSGVHEAGQIPVQITVPGSVVAVWIPAQTMVVATDAAYDTGGAYVTVAVGGHDEPARTAQRAAEAAARATFAAHPDRLQGAGAPRQLREVVR
jgi:hypothetical protein